MDDPKRPAVGNRVIRLAELRASGPQDFVLEPDAETRAQIAAELDLSALRKLRLSVRLIPEGKSDWRLEGTLGATVVQPCVATLAPVTTRIEAEVSRRYLADPPETPEADEVEMPDDDVDPLPAALDLKAVMIEDLALNLPLYPHVDGVAPVAETFAEPGIAPMSDEETKPFAGLAGLRDKLGDTGD